MIPVLSALVQAGILPQAVADTIDRQLSPEAARLHAEGVLIESFRNGLSLQQRRILGLLDDTQGQVTPRQLSLFWNGENDLLWASVQEDIISVLLENSTRVAIGLGDVDTWNLINQSVIEWAETYYIDADGDTFGSIPNLNLHGRSVFERAFVEWQRGELQSAGYTDGLPQLIRALEPAFGLSRATRVGVTETSRIFAMSEIMAGRANEFITQFEWATAVDERVCEICSPRNGQRVAKSASGFSLPTDDLVVYPPAHVMCRCSLIPLTDAAARALDEG